MAVKISEPSLYPAGFEVDFLKTGGSLISRLIWTDMLACRFKRNSAVNGYHFIFNSLLLNKSKVRENRVDCNQSIIM